MSRFSNHFEKVVVLLGGMALFAVANAAPVNITGTIVDKSTSKGIYGAIIKMVEAPLVEGRSKADGNFSLMGMTGVIPTKSTGIKPYGEVRLNGNTVSIKGIQPATKVVVDIYKCNGARINHFENVVGASGVIACANLWQANGAYIIRIRFNGQEYNLFSIGKKKTSFLSNYTPENRLGKVAETYTLDISAAGYSRQQKSITTVTGKIDTIRLEKVQNGVTVYLDSVLYPMDGFGACIAYDHPWGGPVDAAEFLFGLKDTCTYKGAKRTPIGLSTFRIATTPQAGIPDGSKTAIQNAYKVNPNIRFWGAPWSPAAQFKTSGATNSGGLKADSREGWATMLATNFPKAMKDLGVPSVYCISAQNEPDIQVSYDMCSYNPQELAAFCKVLGPKLHALNPPIKLLAIEVCCWDRFGGYYDAIKKDSATFAAVDIFASHAYAGTPGAPIQPNGKVNWQTEVWDCGNNAVGTAKQIHDNIVRGNCSAFHWWEFQFGGGECSLLDGGGGVRKNCFGFGAFSKFVRPGFMRVFVDGVPNNVQLTAYRDSTNTPVVVAINNGGSQTITISTFGGAAPKAVTPWVTSGSEDLVKKDPITVKDGVFTATLAGNSVTSFTSY
jgi:glucuronoarabinoxylan endo-1,4-beta-xylanase